MYEVEKTFVLRKEKPTKRFVGQRVKVDQGIIYVVGTQYKEKKGGRGAAVKKGQWKSGKMPKVPLEVVEDRFPELLDE